MGTLIQVVGAILGIAFLIFIHELGHYWVARREGMKVDVFSIGFGRPIYSWTFQGVKWQLGWFLFGGYVKIAGMDGSEAGPDSFYAKGAWSRIKVAFAGPLFNGLLALVIFFALWVFGGRLKPFSEYTHQVGWVDTDSTAYQQEIRPGDLLTKYDAKPYNGFKDLIYASILSDKPLTLTGEHVHRLAGKTEPFQISLPPYPYLDGLDGMRTYGILSAASYLFYQGAIPGAPLPTGLLKPNDRLIWADGEILYSQEQLSALLNSPIALLTVEREGKRFLYRALKVQVNGLKMAPEIKGELSDWKYDGEIEGPLSELWVLPFSLNASNQVEDLLLPLDIQERARWQTGQWPFVDAPLKPKDKIVAIYGKPVATPVQLLQELQTRKVLIIAEKLDAKVPEVSWKEADQQFNALFPLDSLKQLLNHFTQGEVSKESNLLLLPPLEAKPLQAFALTGAQKEALQAQQRAQLETIAKIRDSSKRAYALRLFEESQTRLMLGVQLQDQKVRYNPDPLRLFANTWNEVWQTLGSLFSGQMSPKWLSGPIGVVQVIQHSWSVGVKEALFWMATISVNLGLLNLLPIPVLDGGYILLGFIELITGKRLPPKMLEKIVWPFFLLLIAFFLFVTYYDLSRLF